MLKVCFFYALALPNLFWLQSAPLIQISWLRHCRWGVVHGSPDQSFCSQPVATEGVPDLAVQEEGEDDGECGHGGKFSVTDSPSSSSASQVHEATEDLINVPDIDNTDNPREPPSQSQRTPTPWPQRVQLGKIPDHIM